MRPQPAFSPLAFLSSSLVLLMGTDAQTPVATPIPGANVTQWNCATMYCTNPGFYTTWVYGTPFTPSQPCYALNSPMMSITGSIGDQWGVYCPGPKWFDLQYPSPVTPNGYSEYTITWGVPTGITFSYTNTSGVGYIQLPGGPYNVPTPGSNIQQSFAFSSWNTVAATNWNITTSVLTGVYETNNFLIQYLCPAGYYATSTTTCAQCAAGTYNNGTLSAWCYSCPSGKTSPAGSQNASACAVGTPCAIGTYSATGYAPCTGCPATTYNPSTQATACLSCTVCTIGQFYLNQCNPNYNTGCAACYAGAYCPINTTLYIQCPAGTYCPSTSMTAFIPCGAGNYCPSGGLTAPTRCPAGSYCPGANMSTPTPCTPGAYLSLIHI